MTEKEFILAFGKVMLLRYYLPAKYHEHLDELQANLLRDYQGYEVRS